MGRARESSAVDIVRGDPAVNRYWDLIASSLTEEDKQVLLEKIVELWITVRGHSLASEWLHDYKREKTLIGRKKGLRKSLFRAKEKGANDI